jgi:hypothetical protein
MLLLLLLLLLYYDSLSLSLSGIARQAGLATPKYAMVKPSVARPAKHDHLIDPPARSGQTQTR